MSLQQTRTHRILASLRTSLSSFSLICFVYVLSSSICLLFIYSWLVHRKFPHNFSCSSRWFRSESIRFCYFVWHADNIIHSTQFDNIHIRSIYTICCSQIFSPSISFTDFHPFSFIYFYFFFIWYRRMLSSENRTLIHCATSRTEHSQNIYILEKKEEEEEKTNRKHTRISKSHNQKSVRSFFSFNRLDVYDSNCWWCWFSVPFRLLRWPEGTILVLMGMKSLA